jgi:hypothetical protein
MAVNFEILKSTTVYFVQKLLIFLMLNLSYMKYPWVRNTFQSEFTKLSHLLPVFLVTRINTALFYFFSRPCNLHTNILGVRYVRRVLPPQLAQSAIL